MITNNKFDHFSVLVVGNDPEERISKFDEMSDTTEPYILHQYKDRAKIKKIQTDVYEKMLKVTKDLKSRNMLIDTIKDLKKISDDKYFFKLGEFHQFDSNNNIITYDNPDGKWLTCDIGGRMYSDKLKDFQGNGVTSDKKQNVNWNEIHLNDKLDVYRRTWELCVEKLPAKTPLDDKILNNMKGISGYFEEFVDINQYIKYNTSFWTNAIIVGDKWYDIEDGNYFEWILGYYDKFIKPLKNDEMITIFECTR